MLHFGNELHNLFNMTIKWKFMCLQYFILDLTPFASAVITKELVTFGFTAEVQGHGEMLDKDL